MALIAAAVFDLIGRVAAAPTVREVWRMYIHAARISGFSFGMMFDTSASRDLKDRIVGSSMPDGWLEYYSRQDYAPQNPLVNRLRDAHRSFRWNATQWDAVATPAQLRWRDDNVSAGMQFGMAVPKTSHRDDRVIAMAGATSDIDPKDRLALEFAGLEAMHRVRDLLGQTAQPQDTLSSRERECLHWIAAGKSDWEIGQILSISEKTVNVYVERAKRKLNARTRIQAVISAMHGGIIRP